MSEQVRLARVISPADAGTTYGQQRPDRRNVPEHVGRDVRVSQRAANEWRALKTGIRGQINSADNPDGRGGRLVLRTAGYSRVSGLRRSIRQAGSQVSAGFDARRQLRLRGADPNSPQAGQLGAQTRSLPEYQKKLELLCQFDRLSGQMRGTGAFGRSKQADVADDMAGLDRRAFDNVNVNLKDDILLAKQNKLLSVSKHFPAEGFGKVKSQRSRQLIRQVVAATLMQHGYAAAKRVKQDLTKYCELSEKSGTDSTFANHVRGKMTHALQRINNGDNAAQVHAEVFPEFGADTERANMQRASQDDWNDLLGISTRDVPGGAYRTRIREAVLLTVAKGTPEAGRRFRAELRGKTPAQQLQLANTKLQALSGSKAHEPHIYYNPFRPGAILDDENLRISRANYASKPHYTTTDSTYFGSPLKNMDDNHVLAVNGHGDENGTQIQSIDGPRDKMTESQRNASKLTATQLAERLERDGLPKTHKVIRLLPCYSGGSRLRAGPNNDFSQSIQANYHNNNYARQLAIALRARGYNDIIVGGYPGETHTGSQGRKKGVDVTYNNDRSGKVIEASGLCNYFNGLGQRIPNPRNLDKRLGVQQLNQRVNQRL